MFFVEHEITILKLMTFFVLFLFSNKIGMEGKPGRKSLETKVTGNMISIFGRNKFVKIMVAD